MNSTASKGQNRANEVRLRGVVELAIGIAIAWMLIETWWIEGLLVPVWVPSGSMAETLLGTHREVTCGDCGYHFVCGTDLKPASRQAVCPNCGYVGNDLSRQPELDGDRLLIDKSAFLLRRPHRWEVVAFRHPFHAEMICVKRVVGLPGESIEIRHGDLYVDGRIQSKTLAQQRVMSVLVYDANHPTASTSTLPPCWQNDRGVGGWAIQGGRFLHAAKPRGSSVDWCVFHHWQRGDRRGHSAREVPVCDDYGYNQGGLAGASASYAVADLRLAFRLVHTAGAGRLLVRAADGDQEILVRLDPGAKHCEVLSDNVPVPGGSLAIPTIGENGPHQLDVSLVDRQFLLAIDDRTLVMFPLDQPGHLPHTTARRLSIGADSLELEIGDVQVYRDIYYTDAGGGAAHWALDRPVHLGGDEYFVLGDNSPVSDDSRTWPQGPGVPSDLLFGKPLLVHFPVRQVNLWGWCIQLPDLAKIRYIR